MGSALYAALFCGSIEMVPDRLLRALLKFARGIYFQSSWQKLFHYAKIGMNYWGGATIGSSGEEYGLRHALSKLEDKTHIVIFDVGANAGQFANLVMKEIRKKKTIYCFEPARATFEELRKWIDRNSSADEIVANNVGLGSVTGNKLLYSSEPGSTIASLYQLENPLRQFKEEYTELVGMDTIDNFCRAHLISRIDYLKLDVEGHEFEALLGASDMISEGKVLFIQFEFGECHIDSRTFMRDFFKLFCGRYLIYRIVANGLVPLPSYSANLEVFSTANYLAELRLMDHTYT